MTIAGDGSSESGADGLPRAGDVIGGKYQITKVLGVGGMGVVVAVKHLQLNELYAMKFLLPGAAGDKEMHGRFMREARAAVRIKSEHVARVADVGELDSGAPYLLMEYLEGTDLADLLTNEGPLRVATACEYVMQAAAGIAEAHALGIVHRDLKPANLFLTRRSDGAPLVKVLDFGIAKAIEEGPFNSSLTETQSVFGSPAYMSPEQLRSAKNVDARTDIWGLGVILYELLTGTSPWQAETQSGLLAAIAADAPDPLRGHRPEIPMDLEEVVMRCLEKDRSKRFQDVAALVSELSGFAEESGVVSVERVLRLSKPDSSRSLPVVVPRVAPAPASSRTEFARTEKPWTTQRDPGTKSNRFALLGLAALGCAAALVVGVVFLKRSELAGQSPASPATATSSIPVASVSTSPVVEPAPSVAPPATSSVAAAPPPPPKVVGTKPVVKTSPTHVTSAAPAPIPPPVVPAHPPVKIDPLESSH